MSRRDLKEFVNEHNNNIAKTISEMLKNKISHTFSKKAIVIAINGCTGVGKSFLARKIFDLIRHGTQNISCTMVETDGWIMINRKERMSKSLSGVNPDIYDLEKLQETIKLLSVKEKAPGRKYDHKEGRSLESEEILPSDIVIIDGQMSTHPKLINFVDYSIWIGCSMETHRQMRMERDIYYRAYSPDEAKMNWDLHAHDWQNFEQICKPKNCIELLTNRSYILIDECENLKDNAMDYPFTLFTDLGNEIV